MYDHATPDKPPTSQPEVKEAQPSALWRGSLEIATAQGLDTNDFVTLERGGTIDAQAGSEDQYKSCTRQAPRKFSRIRGSKRTELDERTGYEKTVSKPNFNTSQKWCNASSIGRQVGEEVGHVRRRCHRRLEHANERITIDWLDYLHLISGSRRDRTLA